MGDPRPHVVMMVANDVSTDTRVKKEALALAQAGLRVTVVGAASPTNPGTTRLGPVEIVRIPVTFVIRDEVLRRQQARRTARPPLVGRERAAAVRARLQARERDITSRAGLSLLQRRPGPVGDAAHLAGAAWRRARRQAIRGRRLALRAQGAFSWHLDKAIASAWERHDEKVIERGRVRWRSAHPDVLDYELAFGPVLDELQPDAVHAHDMHLVGVAANARARAKAAGRDLPWVYDSHEFVPGLSQYGGRTAPVIAGWADLEREYVRDAARVVTVSPAIAEALEERYRLPRRPTVVLNIPTIDPPGIESVTPLREVCGVAEDVPLLSYSGVMQAARGVHTAIDAMQELTEAHLALVCVPHNDTWFVRKLRQQVAEQGVGDRVHFVNPVGPGQVVDYLRGVDVGLIPGLSFPSHEMSLPNKLFEYLHASVPVASSELQSLGAFMREHGVGVTFPPGDVEGLAAAVHAVLADHDRFRSATQDPELLARYSWAHEADELRRLYAELLDVPLKAVDVAQDDGDEIVDLTESHAPAV